MKYSEVSVLNGALRSCIEIVRTSFQSASPSWLREAAFIKLIINLKDALALLNKLENRIYFTNHLPTGVDITKQVLDIRNAACHVGSATRFLDQNCNSLHFGVAIGKSKLMRIGDVILECEFEDDVASFYGTLRLFLVRHIHRAIKEALPLSERLAKENGHHWHPIS